MEADLVVHGCSMLLTVPPGKDGLGIIRDGAFAVSGGRVIDTGPSGEILYAHKSCRRIDAGGRLVMPGFVDCHTHLIHGGDRVDEMFLRLSGKSYLEILAAGGGIHSTVAATAAASDEELRASAAERLLRMAAHGTTTVEVKSGYGSDADSEERILRCAGALAGGGGRTEASVLPAVVPTYLGAHSIPPGAGREELLEALTGPALTRMRSRAEFCDVFCEEGAFSLEESRRILTAAAEAGFKLKIHAGQFTAAGGAAMAAELGAASADHLEHLQQGEAAAMAAAGTAGVLLPGVSFFLGSPYADGRALADAGVRVALATDYNPGSCPSYSMPFMISLAVSGCGLNIVEAVRAATTNAAAAICRQEGCGSLVPGMNADFIFLDLERPEEIPYYFGTNPVVKAFRGGY